MVSKRRTRKHPGVTLVRPNAARRTGWRIRFKDPDSGAVVWKSLDPALKTMEARIEFAVRKSEALARRRLELEGGAPALKRTDLEDAVAAYLTSADLKSERTRALYKDATDRFLEWAKPRRIRETTDVTSARLAAFREHLASQPLQVIQAGGVRGEHRVTNRKPSPHTINWRLRVVRAMANHWRGHGLAPLTKDTISDSLRSLKAPKRKPSFLEAAEIRRLLEACMRHDAEVHDLTRAEAARGLKPGEGSTPRYQPVAPFAMFLLLSGCRIGEALGLDWSHVRLDTLGAGGKVVGTIKLPAELTKTDEERDVWLDVSPALHRLLSAMRLRGGGKGSVFGLSRGRAEAARKRLLAEYGAPSFAWQQLRRTTATYLVNATAIYGGANTFLAAKQLGHDPEVANKHYRGLHKGIPHNAATLEAAMQAEAQMAAIIDGIGARPRAVRAQAV
jgi:integrase